MKSRLAASLYLFSSGTCWRNTRSTMSSRSIVTCFDRRHCQIDCSFQAQRFESSSRHVHSSTLEDDAFSELGPGISECSAKKIKLVTEKPDHFVDDAFSELGPGLSECSAKQIKLAAEKPDNFVKTHPLFRESPSRPLSSDRPSVKEIIATLGKASMNSCPKLGGHGHAPKFTVDTRKISEMESPRSVSIKNIPSTVGLSELVEAISVFGRVSGASFVTASNKLSLKDVDSSRRAILAGKIAVGSQVFPINPLDAVDLVTVRIKNINEKTSDYAIHSICKSVGEFVGLTRTSKDVVDAFFNVWDHTIHLSIVEKLNHTILDRNLWSAQVLTSKSKSSEVPLDEEARYKLSIQIFYHFSELKRRLSMKSIYLEDLEYLNAIIMHIEAVPPPTDPSGSK